MAWHPDIHNIFLSLDQEGFLGQGTRFLRRARTTIMSGLVDSRAQMVVIRPGTMANMELSMGSILPCSTNTCWASNIPIRMIRCIFLKLEVRDEAWKTWTTRQLGYVTNHVNRLFLSQDALGVLKRIPHNTSPMWMAGMMIATKIRARRWGRLT
jgi:hypothetical protein